MHKLYLLSLLSLSLCGMELSRINPALVRASSDLGKMKLYHSDSQYLVKHNGLLLAVENHDVDPILKTALEKKCLSRLLETGAIKVHKLSDGSFALESKGNGRGGGPLCAWWAYCFAKGTLYGSAAVAAGAVVSGAVVASGGGVIPAAIAAGAGKTISIGVGVATAGTSTMAGIAAPPLPVELPLVLELLMLVWL